MVKAHVHLGRSAPTGGFPSTAGASVCGHGLYRLDIDSRALSINEGRLVARAQSGDRLAFEELVRIHTDRLYAVVLRLCPTPHEAEEVT